MALHFQVLVAAALFALASIAITHSSVVQLGASRQADRITGVTNLASATLADLQAQVETLEAGDQELGKTAMNGRVYERTAAVEEGPDGRTFEVTLTIRETSDDGVRLIKRKMVLFR